MAQPIALAALHAGRMNGACRVASKYGDLSADTAFWEHVPVLVEHSDRDDFTDALSVRLLTRHHDQSDLNVKDLKIIIHNDCDPLFLHTLELSEEDFQTLKAEQGILVDFAEFSKKISDLLRRCMSSTTTSVPRFQAVLVVSASESTFKMIETTDFKQLPHISLKFQPGTDECIKAFLALRLAEANQACEQLRQQLHVCSAELHCIRQTSGQMIEHVRTLEDTHRQQQLETHNRYQQAASVERDEHVHEQATLVGKHVR